ncbi:MAG: redoxin domain-containing protein [Chloroflexota bacterium]|nr:redoxin domain-containing protein [Chloroflexota bacterium]
MATVSEGVQAPDFNLPSTSDDDVSLVARRGRTSLVLLFLDDATGGTDTQIAASFRDASEIFRAQRATVIAIAKNDLNNLKEFQSANTLPFELLGDDGSVAATYGVRVRQGFGPFSRERFRRSTFLLDGMGVVRRIFRDVDPEEHVNEVLAALDMGL